MAWDYYDVSDGGWANGNFRSGVKPVDADDVIIPRSTSQGINGTDQSGIKLGELWIDEGYRFNIGSAASPFLIDAACVTHNGDGTLYLTSEDNGSTEYTERVVVNSPNEQLAAYLDGDAIDEIFLVRGAVTLASTLGAAAKTGRIIIGSARGIGDARVTIDCQTSATSNIIQVSGRTWSNNAHYSIRVLGGEFRHNTGTVFYLWCAGGLTYWNVDASDGTQCVLAYLLPGGVLDAASEAENEVKFGDILMWPGSRFIYDPKRTTITNGITKIAGGGKIVKATR
ncbi:MAG: hypothetical protein ACYTEQ_29035 [Planctomycetota bacterium]|jgi:hypothetical protein